MQISACEKEIKFWFLHSGVKGPSHLLYDAFHNNTLIAIYFTLFESLLWTFLRSIEAICSRTTNICIKEKMGNTSLSNELNKWMLSSDNFLIKIKFAELFKIRNFGIDEKMVLESINLWIRKHFPLQHQTKATSQYHRISYCMKWHFGLFCWLLLLKY